MRHADAGERGAIADDRRPSPDAAAPRPTARRPSLADAGITRLLASPFTRCIETLEPLGAQLGIPRSRRATTSPRATSGSGALDARGGRATRRSRCAATAT